MITREELEENSSIYKMLQKKFHLIPTEANETLEVTLATAREATLLQILPGCLMLLIELNTYSRVRRVIKVIKFLFGGERYHYFARMIR